jgi:diacylglycerol diphosphate phosphatase/phosphatidate phosphatase
MLPYRHVLYNESDNEIWKYSYPLRTNTVSPWMVPTISILTPVGLIFTALFLGKVSKLEAHFALVSALACVMTTGMTTNFIKVNVGRFRPHFVARCWPDGGLPVFEPDGRPRCNDAAINPLEGMKSFPSGHTAWSTSGLAFSTFFLLGKTGCFVGGSNGGGPFHLIGSLLPLLGSVWIGCSRMQDYWHHWEDVVVGFSLGFVMAYLFYKTTYAGVMSLQAGQLIVGLNHSSSGVNNGGNNGSGTSGGNSNGRALLPRRSSNGNGFTNDPINQV